MDRLDVVVLVLAVVLGLALVAASGIWGVLFAVVIAAVWLAIRWTSRSADSHRSGVVTCQDCGSPNDASLEECAYCGATLAQSS
ncbi:MAG: hypothetical protein ABEJ59_05940 [Halanaeroarchaeum sp.]